MCLGELFQNRSRGSKVMEQEFVTERHTLSATQAKNNVSRI
mgnify:CR=1 FL=1